MNRAHAMTSRIALLTLLSAALLLVGCGVGGKSKPANFYVLTGIPGDTAPLSASGNSPAIGVGEVVIPNFLDRPQIVTQTGPNQIALSEFNRWGESFQSGITRVLREDVAIYLGTDKVTAFPWHRPFPNDYIIHIVVLSFEAAPYRETLTLKVMYRITDPKQKETFLVKELTLTEPIPGGYPDYPAIVDAMSAIAADLAKDIATEALELPLPSGA